ALHEPGTVHGIHSRCTQRYLFARLRHVRNTFGIESVCCGQRHASHHEARSGGCSGIQIFGSRLSSDEVRYAELSRKRCKSQTQICESVEDQSRTRTRRKTAVTPQHAAQRSQKTSYDRRQPDYLLCHSLYVM